MRKKSHKFYDFVIIIMNTCFAYINKLINPQNNPITTGDRSDDTHFIGEQTEGQN